MTDEAQPKVVVFESFPLPTPKRNRMIWQPVTAEGGKAMRLAPLDWQPLAAHEALEHLAQENEKLRAVISDLRPLVLTARAYRDDMRRIEAGEIEATDALAALEEAAMEMEEG